MTDKNAPLPSKLQGFSSRVAAFTFACVAGYVDAYALIRFQVYASFMSGNTTRGGIEAATAQFSAVLLSGTAIAFFVVGAFASVMILHSRMQRAASLAAAAAAGLLAVQVVADLLHAPPIYSVMLLSVSMGMLNATISQVGGQPINIGYVSGGLHKLAEHLALAWRGSPVDGSQGPGDTHLRRAGLITGVWGAFLFGAMCGTLAESLLSNTGAVIPAVVIPAVLLADSTRVISTKEK